MDLQIQYLPITSLLPYINNSRKHSDAQVAQIAASIKEFGWTNPILVDGDNGIIAGHGRLMAARKLNYDQVPVIELNYLSEAQKKALVIADNKLALNADWDLDVLKLELDELEELDFDLDLLGFSADELDSLFPDEATPGKIDDDEVPEIPEEPKTKPGDIYQLGNHRLMCGDSTSIDAVEQLMNGQKADMVFTDPPYGVEYQSNKRTKTDRFDVLLNDDKFLDIAPIVDVFSTGWMFVWTSWKVQNKWIEMFSAYDYPTNMVIWHKPGGGIGDLKRTFYSDYEVALVWHRGAELCGKRIGSVWTINKDGASTYVHPTQKPVALSVEAIDKTTNKGAIVLDLFGGSGSTLIGCEKTNRSARLMELDPKYCDVIVKRWQEYTGLKAIHTQSGKPFDELENGTETT